MSMRMERVPLSDAFALGLMPGRLFDHRRLYESLFPCKLFQ
jgi:hypothetical protein